MSDRFVYFYFMRSDPEQVRATVPENVSDWHGLALADYLGGPFEDRTGGLITFRADAAQQAVTDDPFVRKGLIETYWLKRWNPSDTSLRPNRDDATASALRTSARAAKGVCPDPLQ
jgi:hypothetical protein